MDYYNNFVRDPKRPSLPEHPNNIKGGAMPVKFLPLVWCEFHREGWFDKKTLHRVNLLHLFNLN